MQQKPLTLEDFKTMIERMEKEPFKITQHVLPAKDYDEIMKFRENKDSSLSFAIKKI